MRRGLAAAATLLSLAYASTSRADEEPRLSGTQELGARLGWQTGIGDVSPGGLRVGGVYLYKLSSDSWSENGASVGFGSGDASCWYDRENALVCDHGVADGFTFQLTTGVRWYPNLGKKGAQPYARAGLGLAYVRFVDDFLTGIALPVHVGAGARFEITERVSVGGEALFELGPAIFGTDSGAAPADSESLGFEAYSSLVVLFTIDFKL